MLCTTKRKPQYIYKEDHRVPYRVARWMNARTLCSGNIVVQIEKITASARAILGKYDHEVVRKCLSWLCNLHAWHGIHDGNVIITHNTTAAAVHVHILYRYR